MHGENASVDPSTCDQWMQQLPQICKGYDLKDIWNCDETGIFFQSVPNKSFVKNGKVPHGTKAQTLTERFTILLCCNTLGEKEKIWIIGKSKLPTSMSKPIPKAFNYRNNQQVWMTSDIFMEFLNVLNNKVKKAKCHIILLLDNCPSHPDIKLSNVKLRFLPKNITSHFQPLDKGIIAWLKNFYKRQLMTEIHPAMDECKTVIELAKKVTIYDAIVNIKDGWDQLPASTIQKCFKTCGIFNGMFDATPIPNEHQTDEMETHQPDEFDHWFAKLLEVPWDEYLALMTNWKLNDLLEHQLHQQHPLMIMIKKRKQLKMLQ